MSADTNTDSDTLRAEGRSVAYHVSIEGRSFWVTLKGDF